MSSVRTSSLQNHDNLSVVDDFRRTPKSTDLTLVETITYGFETGTSTNTGRERDMVTLNLLWQIYILYNVSDFFNTHSEQKLIIW